MFSASSKEISDLYEIFLSGDEEAFTAVYYKDLDKDLALHPVYQEYIKELLDDSNEAWAKKIYAYLEEGGTTFVFAGCAHFTGPNSVFKYMGLN